jgi:hypothetical protein
MRSTGTLCATKNAEMWTPGVMTSIARLCAVDADRRDWSTATGFAKRL